MTFRIAQDSQYMGDDFWKWRAWIEGKAAEMQKVEKVKWFLHPSFTPSVVVSRERASGFRLEASGWGTFLLRAELRLVDATEVTLRHDLEFAPPTAPVPLAPRAAGPAEERVPAPTFVVPPPKFERADPAPAKPSPAQPAAQSRKIFLTSGSEDRRAGLAWRRALETLGVLVLDDSQVRAGLPLEVAAQELIARADATIALVSSDLPSPFVAQQVNASMKAGKPTVIIASETLDTIQGIDSRVPIKQMEPGDHAAIAAMLQALTPAK